MVIFFAAGSVALFCLIGIVVDFGNIFTGERALQGVADFAAIAGATDLANAQAAAFANAVKNAFPATDVASVTLGVYTANPALAPAARFQPSSLATANAVKTVMTHNQKLFFSNILLGSALTVPISAQAMAWKNGAVSFGIGSASAGTNVGAANAVLGAALGGPVALAPADYTALTTAQVDLFSLAKAVAVQLGQPGDTYAQAFTGTMAMSGFIAALEQASPSNTQLPVLLAAAQGGSKTVDLGRLLSFGPFASLPTSGTEPAVTATASLLVLLQAGGLAGNGQLLSIAPAAAIPGIAAVTGTMALNQAPAGSTSLAIGKAGTTVRSAEMRFMLTVSLAGAIAGGVVTIPLYIEIGYGAAALTSTACSVLDGTNTQVTLSVTPGLVNAWIGNVSASAMINFTTEPTPTTAILLNLLGIATVNGRSNVQIGSAAAVPIKFGASDIQNVVVRATDSADFASTLLATLVSNLSLTVTVLGLPVLVPPGLTTLVAAALAAAVAPTDTLVTALLQAAGLNLGVANSWVTGADCAPATLNG